MKDQRYPSEWWAAQNYEDGLSGAVKRRRLIWLWVWGLLAGWMPYYAGGRWRTFLLRLFGLKHSGPVSIYPNARVWAPWNVVLGSHVAIDSEVELYSVDKITIGTKVAISSKAFICTAGHDIGVASRPLITAAIRIEDGVWIGARAVILPGVTIGEGAVVAACAVVTRDVAPWTVVAGNPARVVKVRKIEGSKDA